MFPSPSYQIKQVTFISLVSSNYSSLRHFNSPTTWIIQHFTYYNQMNLYFYICLVWVIRLLQYQIYLNHNRVGTIECEEWRQHSSLIFLILLFTKPNIEVSGWLFQTKTHFTHIVYQPFSRVLPPSFTLYGLTWIDSSCFISTPWFDADGDQKAFKRTKASFWILRWQACWWQPCPVAQAL